MSKVITIKLAPTIIKREPEKFLIDNMFFNTAILQQKDVVYGFVPNETMLAPEIENIFSDISPNKDGDFTVELGAELLELYPNFDNCSEYTLFVKNKSEIIQKIYCSNSMARISYFENNENIFVNFSQSNNYEDIKEFYKFPDSASIEPLKTFLTWQFKIQGTNVPEVFRDYLENRIEEFIYLINEYCTFINLQLSEKGELPLVISSYSRYLIPYFHFIIMGKDQNNVSAGRIATHPKGTAYVTNNFDKVETDKLIELFDKSNEVKLWDLFFISGKSLLLSGQLKSSILALFTCCEIILSMYVHNSLISLGVSKNKLKDNEKNLTFSQMLNVQLIALTPYHSKPNETLVSKINDLRKVRNELVHTGKFELKDSDVNDYLTHVYEFKEFIKRMITLNLTSDTAQ